ncbi:fumarylacetoacetate hydrolase family protein [Frigidibacter sp.]|uniref:fumarylacetoacetate hydrolase family protein n=1 Tax=Frigidibacter sp. TaxID=2586418 RepID=UPI002734A57D|nr:fumarylacetoacetate hydrolase family protein [Frigidibacter sp.]MDP3342530.1 fumarylacetoacetate hydrolase family protein [Frigidibacter sp.]
MADTPRYLFAPAAPTALPVAGTDLLFPVRRVYCVGRNYAEHAREMGGDPDAEPPFFFQKNQDNLLTDGRFPYPTLTTDLHFEVELAVALHTGGDDIPAESALDCVFGYAAALDMTRRDLQAQAKKAGRPWEAAKAAEHSAPIGPLSPVAAVGHLDGAAITLDVNGTRRQQAPLADMIWPVAGIIAHLSQLFTLAPGDVILTGTPAGVGAVQRGDVMEARVDGLAPLRVEVV